MVIQAKDYSHPADSNVVGEFASVIRDVRANKGILIARSGFTASAKKHATNLGIDLCNIHDAESRRWSLEISLPIVWIDLLPKLSFNLQSWFESGDSIPSDPQQWVLSMDKGKTGVVPFKTFATEWNAGRLPRDIGMTHQVHPTISKGLKSWLRTSRDRLYGARSMK